MGHDTVILDATEAIVAMTVTVHRGGDDDGSLSSDGDDNEEYRPKSGWRNSSRTIDQTDQDSPRRRVEFRDDRGQLLSRMRVEAELQTYYGHTRANEHSAASTTKI